MEDKVIQLLKLKLPESKIREEYRYRSGCYAFKVNIGGWRGLDILILEGADLRFPSTTVYVGGVEYDVSELVLEAILNLVKREILRRSREEREKKLHKVILKIDSMLSSALDSRG